MDVRAGPGLGENKQGMRGKLAVMHLASLVRRNPQGSPLMSLPFVSGVPGPPRAAIVVVCVFLRSVARGLTVGEPQRFLSSSGVVERVQEATMLVESVAAVSHQQIKTHQ